MRIAKGVLPTRVQESEPWIANCVAIENLMNNSRSSIRNLAVLSASRLDTREEMERKGEWLSISTIQKALHDALEVRFFIIS